MPGTRYSLEVQPRIPPRLIRLQELAGDLFYSWDRGVRGLFRRLDVELWEQCGHNPKVFLRQVAQDRLEQAAQDRIFMQDYNRVISSYDVYLQEEARGDLLQHLDPQRDLVAYFCAEFGLHESFPIYSGGLGILAGDHCKAASDLGLPFVAVGLLYRQGYFNQTIDGGGYQIAHYHPVDFRDLPVHPAVDAAGNEVHVFIELPGRRVELKVWEARAGHIRLYLLDSDLPGNQENDRSITYQLYGGDIHTRMQQEIALGIGGVRALRTLGIQPTIWHINEDHTAFQILERIREQVAAGLDFDSALELVAAATVFTTHTPVPAGHDIFPHHLMHEYFGRYMQEFGVAEERILALGASPATPNSFNQTALGLRGSRFHNGVSRIHGNVASQMEAYIWPQIPAEENPIGHVTNGVHVPTFLAREWVNHLDMQYGGGWRNELLNADYWNQIDAIPDHTFWSLRQTLKSQILDEARRRTLRMHRRNGVSESQLERLIRHLQPTETDILTIGFARRFATYKRATLLFANPERLARLVNDPKRPVLFIFAGKAHPHDQPGQQLIKTIHDYARRPEFEGRIILLEDYDMALGRKLVTGVDVWLNNPEYPMEASGTSGQKAGINGVINLSVTDGWWGEGYSGDNGWAITPHGPQFDAAFRNNEEANELLDLLEHHVIPLYYQRNGHGYPEGWVKKSKISMKSLLPRFNAQRMVMDYIRDYYGPAQRQQQRLARDDNAPARELATWKRRIRAAWHKITIARSDSIQKQIMAGDTLPIEVTMDINDLQPEDLIVECLVGTETETGEFITQASHTLTCQGRNEHGATLFRIDLRPRLSGMQYYKLRAYPYHKLLSHPFEMGYMIWV
ncbi:MAG: alpha-glucan family phosphorylase [Pseudomonadota bacterium]